MSELGETRDEGREGEVSENKVAKVNIGRLGR